MKGFAWSKKMAQALDFRGTKVVKVIPRYPLTHINPLMPSKYKSDGKNRAFIDNGYEHQTFKVTQRKS